MNAPDCYGQQDVNYDPFRCATCQFGEGCLCETTNRLDEEPEAAANGQLSEFPVEGEP